MTIVRFEQDGVVFEATPDSIGTDPVELEMLGWMEQSDERCRARIASLRDNVRHAYEMLLTAEVCGRC